MTHPSIRMFSTISPPTTISTDEVPVSSLVIVDYPDACVFLSAVSCILSVLGALGIFITYGRLAEIRNVTRKLIICLTVADLFTAAGILISVYRYFRVPTGSHSADQLPTLCTIQSVITSYSSLVSFFLTVSIGAHLVQTVTNPRCSTGTRALVIFNAVSWLVPGVLVGVAYANDALGEDKSATAGTGPWCWIDTSNPHRIMWMWLIGKGWEIGCYLVTISIYVLLKFFLYLRHNRRELSEIHASLRNEDKNVLYLWLVLYLIRMWGTIRFFIYYADPDVSKNNIMMHVLLYLQAIGDPAQAFCNFLAFCVFDATVKKYFKMRYNAFKSRISCDINPTFPAEVDTQPMEVASDELPRDRLLSRNTKTYGSINDTKPEEGATRASSELNLYS